MKLQVIGRKGNRAVIELESEIRTKSHGNGYSTVYSGNVEYVFNEDGFYDGWGMDISAKNLTEAEILALVESVQKSHRVPSTDSQEPESMAQRPKLLSELN